MTLSIGLSVNPQDPQWLELAREAERVQMGPGRSGLSVAIDRMPDKEQKIVFVRMREFERNMTGTLERIKALAEA